MSLFLLTTVNDLPEQFRAGIDINNKSGIAEQLISESFLTRENFDAALVLFKTVTNLGSYRIVEGYKVTNITCLPTEEEATNLYNIIMTQRQKNATEIGRTWVHPEDALPIITSLSEDEWFNNKQPELIITHTAINPDNLVLI